MIGTVFDWIGKRVYFVKGCGVSPYVDCFTVRKIRVFKRKGKVVIQAKGGFWSRWRDVNNLHSDRHNAAVTCDYHKTGGIGFRC
jgi:hypothetical protein